MTARTSQSKDAVVLRTYDEFDRYIQAFASGKLNLLIVVGRAGVAKSQSVRRLMPVQHCWIESNASSFGIYSTLHAHKDQLVVIDDVDSLYADRSAVRLLKCLCQTDPVKTLAWHTASAGSTSNNLPRSFETKSRVCIIANDWKSLNANTAAVEDRGHVVVFDPSALEVHKKVSSWFWDQEVFDWFASFLHLIPDLSMRHYVRAAELKSAGIDWASKMLSDDVPEKLRVVAGLMADPRFTEERKRVAAFSAMGHGGKTTWYKLKKKIKHKRDTVPYIPLRIDLSSGASAKRVA
jgi:hypothetical protein